MERPRVRRLRLLRRRDECGTLRPTPSHAAVLRAPRCCLAVTMPIDVVKTRLQMDGSGGIKQYNGSMDCASKLVKADGPGALFKGLPPALVRQSTYGSLRYGLYGPIKGSMGARRADPPPSFPPPSSWLASAHAPRLPSPQASWPESPYLSGRRLWRAAQPARLRRPSPTRRT